MSSQIQTIKSIFNGGEMSPVMDGRTDAEKYATGCRMLENFMVRSYGGAFKRPGTRFGSTLSFSYLRAIPFRLNTTTNYVVLFKADRILINSYSAGVFEYEAQFVFDPGQENYTAEEIPLLHYVQLNNVMFITCPTKHPKRLTRISTLVWTLEDVPFQFAPVLDATSNGDTLRIQYNADDWSPSATYTLGDVVTLPIIKAVTNVLKPASKIQITSAAHGLSTGNTVTVYGVGGATNANITSVITRISADVFELNSSAATLPATYTAGTGAWYVTTNSTYPRTFVYNSATTSTAGILLNASWTEATYSSSWNIGATYPVGVIVEYKGSNYVSTSNVAASATNAPDGTAPTWVLVKYKSTGLQITNYRLISSSSTVFSANEIGSNWLLSPTSTKRFANELMGSASLATITSSSVFIQDEYIFRTTWLTNSAPVGTVVRIEESFDQVNYSSVREWYINHASEGTIVYTGKAPNTGAWYRAVTIRAAAASSAAQMTIEPVSGILNVPFLLNSYSASVPWQVIGVPKLASNSLIPNEVLGSSFAIYRKSAFSVDRGYPRTLAFHDQRLFFASTATEPTRIWGSQTDDFYTFLPGAFDTSGIDVTLAATQSNEIQWLASFKRTMVIGTSGEEWTMDTGDTDSALTPSNVRLRRWSRYGSSNLQPVLSGDSLLWLTRDDRLREFAYVFEKDGYSAPDMTLLAEHIPRRSPVEYMTYSQSPDPIVWLVHADGSWSGFTYDRENSVTAWHSHRTASGDKILSLCTLYSASTSADSLIFLTLRRNGSFTNLESIDGSIMVAAVTSADINYATASPTQHSTGKAGFFCDCYSILTPTGIDVSVFDVVGDISKCSRSLILGTTSVGASGQPIESTSTGGGQVIFNIPSVAAPMNVGLPYTAYIIPNRTEVQLRDGTAQMRKWRVARAAFRLFRSFYGQVWNRLADANYTYSTRINTTNIDAFPISPSLSATTTGYVTGQTLPDVVNHDWNNCLDIVIASRHPLPFNLTGMILDVEIDGTSGAGL
jgi:hypothetical protein